MGPCWEHKQQDPTTDQLRVWGVEAPPGLIRLVNSGGAETEGDLHLSFSLSLHIFKTKDLFHQ